MRNRHFKRANKSRPAISLSAMNDMQATVEALSRPAGAAFDSRGLAIPPVPPGTFPAKITGSSGAAYAWLRQAQTTTGYTNHPDGQFGTATSAPAYEVNGSTGVAVGTVVFLKLRPDRESYEFAAAGEGGGGTATTLTTVEFYHDGGQASNDSRLGTLPRATGSSDWRPVFPTEFDSSWQPAQNIFQFPQSRGGFGLALGWKYPRAVRRGQSLFATPYVCPYNQSIQSIGIINPRSFENDSTGIGEVRIALFSNVQTETEALYPGTKIAEIAINGDAHSPPAAEHFLFDQYGWNGSVYGPVIIWRNASIPSMEAGNVYWFVVNTKSGTNGMGAWNVEVLYPLLGFCGWYLPFFFTTPGSGGFSQAATLFGCGYVHEGPTSTGFTAIPDEFPTLMDDGNGVTIGPRIMAPIDLTSFAPSETFTGYTPAVFIRTVRS